MPVRKPSTAFLARRSSREMRAMVSGCRKRRGSSVLTATYSPRNTSRRENPLVALVAGQLALAARRFLEQLLHDGVGGDPFRGRGEVGQDAVPQDGRGERLDVFGLHVRAAVEQGRTHEQ